MPGPIQLRIISGIVFCVFAIGLIVSGTAPNRTWFNYYSWGVMIVAALSAVWDTWLWKTWIGQIFSGIPVDLSGTWRGTLATMWVDPANNTTPPPKPAYIVIRQTWSKISVVLLTNESNSQSTFASVRSGDIGTSLVYMYINTPDIQRNKVSPIHYGSTMLVVTGRPATRLKGSYWTSRDSKGSLDLTLRNRLKVDDYDQAERLFESAG